MKNTFFKILSIIVLSLCIFPGVVSAELDGEKINSFDVSISIQKDGSALVTEKIEYDFGDNQKHGIYRTIPTDFVANGQKNNIRISINSVTNEKGNGYTYTVTSRNPLDIKIGDPDKTISGVHVYIISYTVKNAVGFFEKFDEIYWNLTGNEWTVPISKVSARVHIPAQIEKSDFLVHDYCGQFGSTRSCGLFAIEEDGQSVSYKMNIDEELSLGEGVTIGVGFPKGMITLPVVYWWEKPDLYYKVALGSGLFVFIIFFVWLFGTYIPAYNSKKRPIITEYEPPQNVTPAQAISVYRGIQVLPQEGVPVDILYLASLGYLSIHKDGASKSSILKNKIIQFVLPVIVIGFVILVFGWFGLAIVAIGLILKFKKGIIHLGALFDPATFSFTRLQEQKGDIPDYLVQLLETVTRSSGSKSMDEIKEEKNYYKFNDTYDLAQKTLVQFFPQVDFSTLKNTVGFLFAFIAAPFFIIFFGIFVAVFTGFLLETTDISIPFEAIVVPIVFIGSVLVTFFVKKVLDFRLARMSELWYHIAGLRQYIQVAEKDRLAFESDPEKASQTFARLLPYAVAFGFGEKWATAFKGIALRPPTWYQSGDSSFSATNFAVSMSAFSAGFSGVTSSGQPVSSGSSGSSGGGSSGGGGGGGGGGSW